MNDAIGYSSDLLRVDGVKLVGLAHGPDGWGIAAFAPRGVNHISPWHFRGQHNHEWQGSGTALMDRRYWTDLASHSLSSNWERHACDLVGCGVASLAIGLGRVSRWQTLSFDTASPYKRPTCQGLTSVLGTCRDEPMPRSNACVRRPISQLCYKRIRSMPTVALSKLAWHLVSELRTTPCIAS